MNPKPIALAVVCSLSAASPAAEVSTPEISASVPPRGTKGLNLLASGTVVPEHDRVPVGFLLGGGFEFPVGLGVDLNLGMSFQRFGSVDGPVTMVNVVDVTASRHAKHSVFFGAGVGPVIALGNVRPGAKLFGGIELFHQGAVPLQVGLELILKFCEENSYLRCAPGEKQAWLAGRFGVRL